MLSLRLDEASDVWGVARISNRFTDTGGLNKRRGHPAKPFPWPLIFNVGEWFAEDMVRVYLIP